VVTVLKDRATIEQLAADPALAARLPAEAIPALMGELAARQAALSAVSSALAARWMEATAARAGNGSGAPSGTGDELLNVRQAAAKLNMSPSWLYQNAWRFPFLVRQGGALRFSRCGLERYLEARQVGQGADK
jgi:predicted DNA-binding transcriptional regulator AlpA